MLLNILIYLDKLADCPWTSYNIIENACSWKTDSRINTVACTRTVFILMKEVLTQPVDVLCFHPTSAKTMFI